jgi:hypothetical protein
MAKVFANDMVAHVWAQMRQDEGKSGNGNFYFTGARLYSYGSHFLAGYIDSAGVAFLNSDSYSISTSRHQSYAARAVSHRDHFYISDLTAFRDVLEFADWRDAGKDSRNPEYAKRRKAAARKLLLERASALTGRRNAYRWNATEGDAEEAGAYLARRVGLPAASWAAIKRERERLDAAKAKADKRKADKAAHALAVRYATMSDSEWRDHMRKDSSKYESFYDREAKALYHAARLAKAEGFSAKRQAAIKSRRADALRRKAGYHGAEKSYQRWNPVRYQIAMVRSCQRILSGFATDGAGPHGISARTEATRKASSSLAYLSNVAAFPSAARFRMRAESARLDSLLPALQSELDAFRLVEREREQREYEERQRLNRLAQEERVAAWLDGADVRVTFDAESGGAALRIRGDMLETSHGASVPLAHAVKAFRFVKLMRTKHYDAASHSIVKVWERNGKTIRVGHFQIDRIFSDGGFVAGCHNFTWPEIERAAALAGVLDAEADDSAVVSSAAA